MADLKLRIKQMLIDALKLDGVTPESIDDSAPLFGGGGGLGLDSLDALQLAVSVEETFGVQVADEKAGKTAFASVNALASYIAAQKPAV
ncbi:MAG: acyl carrier protein [Deltaproteobacteria bacterium]|nr:acyl carrier protein [Deltaproteobacteria bacterium]